MRFNRLAIVLGAIVIFSGSLGRIAAAQDYDALFAPAKKLETEGRRQEAHAAYRRVADEQSRNPEVASEALYQAGKFASERYGGTADEKRFGEEAAAREDWRRLVDDYPGTKAYLKLTGGQRGGPRDELAALENRIDKRNSSDWKYQVLHSLVALTGSNPAYSYAFALILLAVIVKIILLPLTKKQYAGMREMQRMQPLVKELQKKYQGAELNQKMMGLYKEHGVNPFAGCWPTLLQLPFLILVFNAIREYEFAFTHGKFLWIGSSLTDQGWRMIGHDVIARNLASPDIILLAIYALTNYVTMKMTPTSDPAQQQQQNTMALVMTGFFFWMFLSYRWSSAFVLYWLALNLLSIWQQYEYIYKPHKEQTASISTSPPKPPDAGSNGAGKVDSVAKPVAGAKQTTRVRPRKKKR